LGELRGEENPSYYVVAFVVEVNSYVSTEFDVLFSVMAFSYRIRQIYYGALFQRPN
jgi:hypothetical protein